MCRFISCSTVSVPSEPHRGAYQGSALGPLLHVYANDLPWHTDEFTGIIAYADGVQSFASCPPKDLNLLIRIMESSLSMLSDWYGMNGLKINAAKMQPHRQTSLCNVHGLYRR